ncbi:uncharacterized protein PRCAT00005188001 [Priceomyces carsonii]|uniref:uncharacterized protein n=1 Tax=Priceomyces carsonii TaxID=28549 RepID=UPI002EDA48B0|nr:unnamed protein product [Priceomyces carsonii]
MSDKPIKDVSMVDVSNTEHMEEAIDPRDLSRRQEEISPTTSRVNHFSNEPPQRRRSTMILTDDMEMDKLRTSGDNSRSHDDDRMTVDSSGQGANNTSQQPQGVQPTTTDPNVTVPVDIKWVQGGEKVYVTGSFTEWRKMIGLVKQPDNTFMITLGLPLGTHRFRFVVDNELRFSDHMPTATDQMGNFVNYIEVTPELVSSYLQENKKQDTQQPIQHEPQPSRKPSVSKATTRRDSAWGLTNDDDDMGDGYSRYKDEDDGTKILKNYNYISDIPPIFTDPKVMEQYYIAIDKQSKNQNGQQQAWLHPPHLPPHLENVILNNFNSMDRDNNSGALPIPNHVVLNHLATTSIKHNTLAVASVVRYKRKYVTQVLYAPLQQ